MSIPLVVITVVTLVVLTYVVAKYVVPVWVEYSLAAEERQAQLEREQREQTDRLVELAEEERLQDE